MNFSLEEDLWWTASRSLTSWMGFQNRSGAYGAVDAATPSDGSVKLVFAPEGRDTAPLQPEELALIAWFEAHEPAVSDAVKAALVAGLAKAAGQGLPAIKTAADLKPLIGLHTINIHPLDGGGVPYMGFEFGCEWDSEHGLGVLMHGTRVVEIGSADTAISLWIAEVDWDNH